MSTYQPFIYLIGWTELNAWYIGAKWAQGCQPLDLWTTYFTSSNTVAVFREDYGEPDYYETFPYDPGTDVQEIEARLICENGLVEDGRWLNKWFWVYGDMVDREVLSKRAKEQWADPAFRQRMSDLHKARLDDQAKAERSAQLKAYYQTDEGKAFAKRRMVKRYEDPAQREKQSRVQKARAACPLERQARKERMQAKWADPVAREEMLAKRAATREAKKKAALSDGLGNE